MPFDDAQADRLKILMERRAHIVETRMFGGFGYLLSGNLCCGLHKSRLMVRLGVEGYASLAISVPKLRPMDLTGRRMKGWGMIDGPECSDSEFRMLVEAAERFARSLPVKAGVKKSAVPGNR